MKLSSSLLLVANLSFLGFTAAVPVNEVEHRDIASAASPLVNKHQSTEGNLQLGALKSRRATKGCDSGYAEYHCNDANVKSVPDLYTRHVNGVTCLDRDSFQPATETTYFHQHMCCKISANEPRPYKYYIFPTLSHCYFY